MSKLKILAVAGLTGLLFATPALAENSNGVEKSGNARERKEARVEAKTSLSLANLEAKRLALVDKFSEKMLKVHMAAVARLKKLADRIDARIDKFESEKKVNLDASEQKLVDARAKITVAENYVNGLGVMIDAAATGTPKTAFETVRGYFATSRANLKAAHSALVDVVVSIKVGAGLSTSTATTTTP